MDGRISYEYNKKHKVSLICNNFLNHSYSLRPLKAEEVPQLYAAVCAEYLSSLNPPGALIPSHPVPCSLPLYTFFITKP